MSILRDRGTTDMTRIDDADYQLLLDEIVTDYPDFGMVAKSNSRLMRVIDITLRVLSFGQMRTFMTSFATTVGHTVYVPDGWDERNVTNRWITLSHERVHMDQAARYGRVWFSFLYLFVLPCLFAIFRTRFEKEAYAVSLRCLVQAYGPKAVAADTTRTLFIEHFTTSQYIWMWVKRSDIEEWYDDTVRGILDDEGYDPDEYLT